MWNRRELTVTEAKRGLPCPKCNPDIKGKPMSLVEKVDAAIKNAIAKGQSPGRAAIEAMTEPTPEMLEEGSDPHGGLSVLQARSCWQSMIDAALKDGE